MNTCRNCKAETTNPKFCSHSCAATHNNQGVRRHGQPIGNCLLCQQKVKYGKNIYCSVKCQQAHIYKTYIDRWKLGLESGYTACGLISNHIHRYLVETRGEQCEVCGWCERHPLSNKVPIQNHHVDGDWMNCREDNLKLLCPSCHSLTLNFGNRNRGKGRPQRYKT
jgi:hypothetical protein